MPAWVNRWSGRLPNKLRSTVASASTTDVTDAAERTPPSSPNKIEQVAAAAAPPSTGAASSPDSAVRAFASHASVHSPAEHNLRRSAPGRQLFDHTAETPLAAEAPPVSAIDANGTHSSSAALLSNPGTAALLYEAAELHDLLAKERERRREADEGRHMAVATAAGLSAQVDALRAEIEALQAALRKLDVHTAASADDAKELAELFARLAVEAQAVEESKRAEEAAAAAAGGGGDESTSPGGTTVLPRLESPRGDGSGEHGAVSRPDAEAMQLQLNTLSLQLDDLFATLEEREAGGDPSLVLLRASWLRERAKTMDDGDVLPPPGAELPPHVRAYAPLSTTFAQPPSDRLLHAPATNPLTSALLLMMILHRPRSAPPSFGASSRAPRATAATARSTCPS